MPEKYGIFEDEADSQYVACVECGDAIDLYESHAMFREDGISELGEVTARTYHFCSDDCLEAWTQKNEY